MPRKISKPYQPRWILNDHWAVDCDRHCWHLVARRQDKDGTLTGWNEDRKKYYANMGQLLESMQRQIERNIPVEMESQEAILEWIEASYDTVQTAADAFAKKLRAEGLYELKRPVRSSPRVTED